MKSLRLAILFISQIIGVSACAPWMSITNHNNYTEHISEAKRDSLVLFVHGLSGDEKTTWGKFPNLLFTDSSPPLVDVVSWAFDSINIDIETLAKQLKTFIDLRYSNYKNIYLVGHSMGGIILQAMIVDALLNCRGRDLQKIRHIVNFAVPVDGVQITAILAALNVNLSNLRADSGLINRNRRHWINRVYNPEKIVGQENCYMKIPTTVVVGAEDTIVSKASVTSYYEKPEPRVVPGDHWSLKLPDDRKNSLAYSIVKSTLAEINTPIMAGQILRLQTTRDNLSASISINNSDPLMPLTVSDVSVIVLSTMAEVPMALKSIPSLTRAEMGTLRTQGSLSVLPIAQIIEIAPRSSEVALLEIEFKNDIRASHRVDILQIVIHTVIDGRSTQVPLGTMIEIIEKEGVRNAQALTLDQLRDLAFNPPDNTDSRQLAQLEALAKLRDSQTLERLLALIKEGEYFLVRALAGYKYNEAVVDLLYELSWHYQKLVRDRALNILMHEPPSIKLINLVVQYIEAENDFHELLLTNQIAMIRILSHYKEKWTLELIFSLLKSYMVKGISVRECEINLFLLDTVKELTGRAFLPKDKEMVNRIVLLAGDIDELESTVTISVNRSIEWWNLEGYWLNDSDLFKTISK